MWQPDTDDVDYLNRVSELQSRLDFLGDRLFHEFEPALMDQPLFPERLNKWLDCVASDDQRVAMLELAGMLYFVGRLELDVLYQEVLQGPVSWWIVEQMNLDILDSTFESQFDEAMRQTWFCALTDSMKIAKFHHINRIEGYDVRPEWKSLSVFADPAKIRSYMERMGYARLVLLEDFVGGGGQASKILRFVCRELPEVPILVAPLLACSSGVESIANTLNDAKPHSVTLEPLLELSGDSILTPVAQPGENPMFPRFRKLVSEVAHLVESPFESMEEQLYGWGAVGVLAVMYTNCPNNVPPMVHHSSSRWSPLFPRAVRI